MNGKLPYNSNNINNIINNIKNNIEYKLPNNKISIVIYNLLKYNIKDRIIVTLSNIIKAEYLPSDSDFNIIHNYNKYYRNKEYLDAKKYNTEIYSKYLDLYLNYKKIDFQYNLKYNKKCNIIFSFNTYRKCVLYVLSI